MRLLIVSDTHLPHRAKQLPPRIWQEVGAADVVFHAGDWVSPQLLEELRSASHHLVGVHGNNDGPELRQQLPEVARLELGGLRFAVVHETGPAKGRERRCDERFPDTDVLIFGHSHIPWDSTTPNGMRLLNPGSPTDRRRQPHHTYMTAELADGELDVHLHRLD
ncbi:metallophosphoesterase family protein [Saccharopolyspora rectivirgula]|jgi:putative phosphoesterase|uniref:Phosphoesterase n=1 Tax=Saccharopolyspora rectivirgula TaxID=28042 RepID=A0A073AX90_9PSEU|nr:metallophosphoesterase [Saccharopolyspora rectivirgula]KEI43956.1 phosphodiesterase [Saccharopolyspora rectivirgula]